MSNRAIALLAVAVGLIAYFMWRKRQEQNVLPISSAPYMPTVVETPDDNQFFEVPSSQRPLGSRPIKVTRSGFDGSFSNRRYLHNRPDDGFGSGSTDDFNINYV